MAATTCQKYRHGGDLKESSSHFYIHFVDPRLLKAPVDADVDCLKCHMIRPRGRTRDLGPFRPELKCCTFDPFIPSFTLGAPEFQARVSSGVLKDYFSRRRLTPLGAIPRNKISLNSPKTNSICDSGRDAEEACAFLTKEENATCTIHEFRPSTCSGYTCRSSRGEAGFKEWDSWETKINSFEWTLSHLAAFELGYTLDDVEQEFSSIDIAVDFYRRAFTTALKISI